MATLHSTVASRTTKHNRASPGQQQKHVLAVLNNTLWPVLAILDIGRAMQKGGNLSLDGWTLQLCIVLLSKDVQTAIRRIRVSGKAQERVAQAQAQLRRLAEFVKGALSPDFEGALEGPAGMAGAGFAIEGMGNLIRQGLNRAARACGISVGDFCIGADDDDD